MDLQFRLWFVFTGEIISKVKDDVRFEFVVVHESFLPVLENRVAEVLKRV